MKQKLNSLILIISLVISLSGCFLTPGDFDNSSGGIKHVIGTSLPAPSGPITPTADGYTFETLPTDVFVKVSSAAEASAAIDEAIANHLVGLVLDFSPFGEGYNPATDFEHICELTSHVSMSFAYSTAAPHILEVSIKYDKAAASISTADPEEDRRVNIVSANDIINRQTIPEQQRRGEDFAEFPIDIGDYSTREVYNSEELWWAVEHGFRPEFAIENSDAERIYNKAKDILRNIISKDMNDFEKALAIYEYIISAVAYDNDTYENIEAIPSAKNACYYLEGVFDYGRAVCDGKSKAFVLLCGIEGIDAVREFGYDERANLGHAWNYVKIDGEWYCVDTTAGDSFKSVGSQPALFFGRKVEITDYSKFLTPLITNADKYAVSGLWNDITVTDNGQMRTDDVLTGRRSEMLVESLEDFVTMISTAIDAGYNEFTLTVSICPDFIKRCVAGMTPLQAMIFVDNFPHELADAAISDLGIEGNIRYRVFAVDIDENDNYTYVFKLPSRAV